MNKKRHSNIWLHFSFLIFSTILLVFSIIVISWYLLYHFNIIDVDIRERRMPFFLLLVGSILLGSSVAIYVGKVIIKPIQELGKGFKRLSEGDFTVRVPENHRIEEMRDISKQFNAMTYDLSHIEALRSDFVANVSHEFKTPLSSIEGYAVLLQNKNLSVEKKDVYINKILENTARLSTLTSNVLLLSKLENQELVLNNKDFRLDEQIRKTILSLEDKWTLKNIQFDLNLPTWSYYGSEQLLEHVWYNIISNAIKFSKQDGIIEIELKEVDKALVVIIKDHGEGMSEDVIKYIFEKFYQGDKSRLSEGNGLGLTLVKRILDICNGQIEVESKEGIGSIFLISLPLVK